MHGKPQIARFRIALSELESEVWRVVDVPSEMSLSHFHVAIQIAMGWLNMHLHEFQAEAACYVNPKEMEGDEGDALDERHAKAAEVMQESRNRTFNYRYDLGGCWDYVIELESVHDFDGSTFVPCCIAGAGTCPLEDSRGTPGYRRCREAFDLPANAGLSSRCASIPKSRTCWSGLAIGTHRFSIFQPSTGN